MFDEYLVYFCKNIQKTRINIQMSPKKNRLDTVRKIISQSNCSSQEELLCKLAVEGYSSTQATLSRDLRELGVVKVHVADGYSYRLPEHATSINPTVRRDSVDGIRSVDCSSSFIVIKTAPAFAGPVSAIIDHNVGTEYIMGTIAGDDTILVILREPSMKQQALLALDTCFPGIQSKLK